MLRRLIPLLAVVGVPLVAGCSATDHAERPEVTFYAHGESVEVPAARFCDPTGESCVPPPRDPVGELSVPETTPLQISVPHEVSSAPWQVAFIYRDAQGREQDGRSPVFGPHERLAYTLRMPADGVRLEHVEVQRFSALLMPGTEGGVDFGIGGSWVLDTR